MAEIKAPSTRIAPLARLTGWKRWHLVRRLLGWQLLFLTIVGALDFADDNLIYVAAGVFGRELHLSDALIGVIPFIEAVGYALTAFFFAVVADRYPRKPLIAFGVLAWAILTAVSGLAFGFLSFALARLLIGGTQPTFDSPAASVVSDLYPPAERGRALGILNAGDMAGILLGFAAEGALIQLYGWRPVFFGVAALAFLVFLLTALCLREPLRGASDGQPLALPTPSLSRAWREGRHALKSEFGAIFGSGVKLIGIAGRIVQYSAFVGAGYFFPILLMDDFHLEVGVASQLLGVVVLASIVGSVVGGWMDGRLYQRGLARHLILAGSALLLMAISYLVGLVIGTLVAVILAGALMGLFMGAANPSLAALVGELHPSGRRAYAFAAQVAPTYLISGFAPLLIGFVATAVGSLRWSSVLFTVVIAVAGVLVVFSSRLARRPARAVAATAEPPSDGAPEPA